MRKTNIVFCGLIVLILFMPVIAMSQNNQKSVKQLVNEVNTFKGENERKNIIRTLSKAEPKSEEEIDQVIELIKGNNENVSFAASNSLSNVKGKNLVPKVILALEDNNNQVKLAAIDALAKLKDKRAVPALVKNLDENEGITSRASMALAEIGDESVIPDLLARIGRPNCPTGVALSRFGAPALRAIVNKIDLADKEERFRMTQTIGFFNDPNAAGELKGLLKNKDAKIRAAAVQSLGNIGDAGIIEALKDDDAIVRLSSIEATRKIGNPTINSELINIFNNDKSIEVRILAADVLADKKCYEAIPYFEKALSDKNKEIQISAQRAINLIKNKR